MTSIETKEIKGVSAKTIYWIIATTAITCATVIGGINKLNNNIDGIAKDQAAYVKYNDLQMKNLEQKVDIQGLQIKELEGKYNMLLENKIK